MIGGASWRYARRSDQHEADAALQNARCRTAARGLDGLAVDHGFSPRIDASVRVPRAIIRLSFVRFVCFVGTPLLQFDRP